MAEQPSDFNMPEKIVTKLLKESLPDNIVISRDAKSAAARGASIFILQLVIAANEHARQAGRRKFDTQDIIKAIADVGLGEYAPVLVRFNAQQKRDAKRKETSLLKNQQPQLLPAPVLDSSSLEHEVQVPISSDIDPCPLEPV